ncbi:MAG: exodeoxyribonuclease VII large subunit, partial [Anaerolineae bacterium]
FTITDFVADLRAPTPSAAAELAVPDRDELQQRIQAWAGQLESTMNRFQRQAREALLQQQRALQRLSPQARIDTDRQRVDELVRRGGRALAHALSLHRSGVAGFHARLVALSPDATLRRGYAIVRQANSRDVVRSVQQVQRGDRLAIQVQDGEFSAVTRVEP